MYWLISGIRKSKFFGGSVSKYALSKENQTGTLDLIQIEEHELNKLKNRRD